jgi:hypothetical protein
MREGWREMAIDRVLDLSIGGVWGSDPGEAAQNVWIVRSTDFRSDGRLDPSTAVRRSLSTRQVGSRQLRTGDILLEKSGGGPNQPVGRVARVSGLSDVTVCSNFVQMLRPKPGLVNAAYLWLVLWHRHFMGITLDYQSQTTGIRNLRTKDYLATPILLPPLDEQHRIVDLIAAVDGAVQAADTVAMHARASFERALAQTVTGDGQRTVPLRDVAALDLDRVTVKPGHTYQVAGVLNAGQGLLKRDSIDGRATNYAALQRLRTNQLVMRKLTAWEGPITVVTEDFDGYFVSPEFPTFTLDQTRVVPGYVRHLCKSPILWAAMRDESTGSVQRRKRVSPQRLLTIHIPLPTILEQSRCAQRLSAFEAVQEAAAQVRTKAVALRSALLANLLSGDYEIPASYDEVIG